MVIILSKVTPKWQNQHSTQVVQLSFLPPTQSRTYQQTQLSESRSESIPSSLTALLIHGPAEYMLMGHWLGLPLLSQHREVRTVCHFLCFSWGFHGCLQAPAGLIMKSRAPHKLLSPGLLLLHKFFLASGMNSNMCCFQKFPQWTEHPCSAAAWAKAQQELWLYLTGIVGWYFCPCLPELHALWGQWSNHELLLLEHISTQLSTQLRIEGSNEDFYFPWSLLKKLQKHYW